MASASWAPTVRPVRIMSSARALPTRRDRRWVPPLPGMRPRLISPKAKLARSPAKTMSQSNASSTPPPIARPLTAAMMGLSKAAMPSPCSQRKRFISAIGTSALAAANSRRSMPAEKAFSPPPVSTAAPTSASRRKASSAVRRSARIWMLIAFMACGRLRVSTATRPCRVTRMVSSDAVMGCAPVVGRPSIVMWACPTFLL